MQIPKRIDYIDIARGLAIIAVIVSHTGYLPFSKYFSPFINAWMIPIFATTGGMLFRPESSFFNFFHKKVNKILIPYIVMYGIGFLGWLILKNGYSKIVLDIPFKEVLFEFLNGRGIIFNGSLWFLPAYLLSLLFAKLISPLWNRFSIPDKIVTLGVTIGILFYVLHPDKKPFFSYDLSIMLLFFILIGRLLSQINVHRFYSVKNTVLLFILMTEGLCINGEINLNTRIVHNPLLFILNSLSASLFMLSVANMLNTYKIQTHVFRYLGKNSLILMSTHWPVMQWITYFIGLTGIINLSNTYPTSTNFFIPSLEPSLGLSLIRISMFTLYTAIPILISVLFIHLWNRLEKNFSSRG